MTSRRAYITSGYTGAEADVYSDSDRDNYMKEAYLNADVGLGVVRHAQAGYETAINVVNGECTFAFP